MFVVKREEGKEPRIAFKSENQEKTGTMSISAAMKLAYQFEKAGDTESADAMFEAVDLAESGDPKLNNNAILASYKNGYDV